MKNIKKSRSNLGPAQWDISTQEERDAEALERGYSLAEIFHHKPTRAEQFRNRSSSSRNVRSRSAFVPELKENIYSPPTPKVPLISNESMKNFQKSFLETQYKNKKAESIEEAQVKINENQKNIKAPTLEEYARLTAENIDKNKFKPNEKLN